MLHIQTIKNKLFLYTKNQGGTQMTQIGEKIKNARNEKGLTQQEVADKLHISRTTISSWENARTLPDINYLILLSEIYELSLDELIKGDQHIMKKIKEDTNVENSNKKIIGALLIWGLVYASFFLITKLFNIPQLTDPFINGLFFLIATGIGLFFLIKNKERLLSRIQVTHITKVLILILVAVIVYSISSFMNQLIMIDWQQKTIKVLATFVVAVIGTFLFRTPKK